MNKGKKIYELPKELLIKIFEELNFSDLLITSLVCKDWYELISIHKFLNRMKVKISNSIYYKIPLHDTVAPALQFISAKRSYYHLEINTCKFAFDDCSKFFVKLFDSIQTLRFGPEMQIHFHTFFEILYKIKIPLKEFGLNKCISPEQFDEISFRNEFQLFCQPKDTVLSQLEKLYINFDNLPYAELNNEVFMTLLIKNASTLKSVDLGAGTVTQHKDFFDVWNEIQLDELIFNCYFNYFNLLNYRRVLSMQTSVKVLSLGYLTSLHKLSRINKLYTLNFLAKTLPLLRKLELGFPFAGVKKIYDLKSLLELKYLENYNLSNDIDQISPNRIVDIFGQNINKKITTLKLTSGEYKDDQLQKIILCYPNLIDLNITMLSFASVPSMITDDTIQCILKNLKRLRSLDLSGLEMITDFGLTGIDSVTGKKTGHSIDELQNLIILNLECCRNLTNLTLIKSIQFIQLKSIILDGNTNYTAEGLEAVVRNCPSLEVFVYSNYLCNDFHLIKQIKRLKTFYRKSCSGYYGRCEVKSFNYHKMLSGSCEEHEKHWSLRLGTFN